MSKFLIPLFAASMLGMSGNAAAGEDCDDALHAELGHAIAAQGNRAVARIKADMLQSVRRTAGWVAPAPKPMQTLIHVSGRTAAPRPKAQSL